MPHSHPRQPLAPRASVALQRLGLALACALSPGCFILRPAVHPPQYAAHTEADGLHVQDLVIPIEGAQARMGDTVEIDYAIWLDRGEQIDSTYDTGVPIQFTLGVEPLPEGLVRGVLGMREGGRRSLAVPPELGFGVDGIEGTVPPNSWLIFQVELRAIEAPAPAVDAASAAPAADEPEGEPEILEEE